MNEIHYTALLDTIVMKSATNVKDSCPSLLLVTEDLTAYNKEQPPPIHHRKREEKRKGAKW